MSNPEMVNYAKRKASEILEARGPKFRQKFPKMSKTRSRSKFNKR
jgi:hypothetical protein